MELKEEKPIDWLPGGEIFAAGPLDTNVALLFACDRVRDQSARALACHATISLTFPVAPFAETSTDGEPQVQGGATVPSRRKRRRACCRRPSLARRFRLHPIPAQWTGESSSRRSARKHRIWKWSDGPQHANIIWLRKGQEEMEESTTPGIRLL